MASLDSGQHSHSSRRGSGDGRDPVEPARAALRRAAAAGIPVHRHAGRRCRSRASCSSTTSARTYLVGSVALALILFDGGLKTRFQSIRTVLAPSMVLATVGVLVTALITAPVAKICARPELGRGAAGRRGGGLDRRRRRVPAGAYPGPAVAPARRRDAGGGIRHQRSVRDLPHLDAGRIHLERGKLARAYRAGIYPRGPARRARRRDRRPARRAGAQSRGAAAGPARAVRHHSGAGDFRRGADCAWLRLSRGLSRRHHHRQPADARA